MIKGTERKMIVLRANDSQIFESAFFVLRREDKNVEMTDMVREANRIIQNATEGVSGKKTCSPGVKKWMFLCVGVMIGVCIASVCFLFL